MTVLRTKIEEHKKLEIVFDKAIEELKEFFNINPNERKPLLILVENRETIDKIRSFRTEEWNVGWIGNGNVYVLCPENYEKESNHKYSDAEYYCLIKHELCHLFSQKISNSERVKPLWLWEGMAIYASGQNIYKKKPDRFKNFTEFYDSHGKEIYYESGFAIEILVDKYSKEKIFQLIKALKDIHSQKDFEIEFKRVYGFEPSIENFNKLL